MKTPTYLKHQPFIVVDNYNKFELFPDTTDAMAMSIGFAQWSKDEKDPNNKDISAKVYRNVDGRWSRQSEELPIHRVINLCILTLASLITESESNNPITDFKEKVIDEENLVFIRKYFKENEKKLLPRIEELQRVIDIFIKKTK